MRVTDPGHSYELAILDAIGTSWELLDFVKREGPGYPGNVGHHPGTTLQETWRVGIDRLRYLQDQEPCGENLECIEHLRACIYLLEQRAARRHGRTLPAYHAHTDFIEEYKTCPYCLHIGCEGECRRVYVPKTPDQAFAPDPVPAPPRTSALSAYPIPVVCACIFRPTPQGGPGYQVLMDKRSMPDNPAYHDKWQLSGGKIEKGESPVDAARREIMEELGVEICGINPLITPVSSVEINGKHFVLIAVPCVISLSEQDKLIPKLGDRLDWINPEHLLESQMVPHDHWMVMRILRQIQNGDTD